jgi:zinc transport system substrate-binding protein
MDNYWSVGSVRGNHPGRGPGGQWRVHRGLTTGLILLLAGFVLCAGCTGPGEAPSPGNLTVAVTVLPQAELVRAVGGDQVDVIVLVPPGADPHTYEPTASQMVALSKARIYFKLGTGLLPFEDRFVSGLRDLNRDLVVVDTFEGGVLIEETGDHARDSAYTRDPHVWFSVRNGEIMVQNIEKALSREDPANASYYAQNHDTYLARLDTLDKTINTTLSCLPRRSFLAVHESWGYFARDYNLTPVIIESHGKEPTAREIAEIVDTARRDGIQLIFVEPQFSTRGAEVIAQEINGTVVTIDPLAPDYYENMVRVSQAFARGAEG